MRKQTKIAALISAAAVLSVGGAMTAFAATGWQQENGTWVYYNRNQEKVSQTWQKSGDYWYYLDDNGEMAADALIEDGDDRYYVDVNGVMVTNRWVAIDNENAGDEGEPNVWWYYFGANGKAYKRNDSSSADVSLKTINGKKYTFDTDGKMQYGWVQGGQTNHDDDAWKTADYYFGDQNDGAMVTGWREISLVDSDAADLQPGDSYWDEDQVRWFYFKSSGKKEKNSEGKTINGKKYGFDQYGRMNAGWYSSATASVSSSSVKDGGLQGSPTYSKSFMNFASPDNGARYTKGWFKTTPGYFLQKDKYEDGSEYWYYADNNGKLAVNEIKTINGKKYAFDEYGRMMDGFVVLQMASLASGSNAYSTKDIVQKVGSQDKYDTSDNLDKFVAANIDLFKSGELRSYYFGDGNDGSMKTGKTNVELDGEKLTFEFAKNGSAKGSGLLGISSSKYYFAGKLAKADADNKVEVLVLDANDKFVFQGAVEEAMSKFGYTMNVVRKSNGEINYTRYTLTLGSGQKAYLINTSGTMIKSGTKTDGDNFKVNVSNYKINHFDLSE